MQKNNEIRSLLLAAGIGKRLRPLTKDWPKCLMPIGKRALLEYWLETLYISNIKNVLVNIHHHADIFRDFFNRPCFRKWVNHVYEESLLGTAGTLRKNISFFKNCTTLLVHADNWCQCNFSDFIYFHQKLRPKKCFITMMTFNSPTPETCGIVETDRDGVVYAFHEKSKSPPNKKANGAVYLIEPPVINWIKDNPKLNDFSTEVIPHFVGKIATWENKGIHRDIGALQMLKLSQLDPHPKASWSNDDKWQKKFLGNPIHKKIIQTKIIS